MTTTSNIIIFDLVFWLPVNLFLFFLLVPSNVTCKLLAESCSPQSCGNFDNIRCPFTLKGANNPHNCSTPIELTCDHENNRLLIIYSTLLPFNNFSVLNISYREYGRIRIVDPGLRRDNCSSLPRYSLSGEDLSRYNVGFHKVFYMNCSTPVDSPYYVDTSPCINSSSSSFNNNTTYYTYVVSGGAPVGDLKDSCRLWMVSKMDSNDELGNYYRYSDLFKNHSYLDIHRQMSSGFNLEWGRNGDVKIVGCILEPERRNMRTYAISWLPWNGRIYNRTYPMPPLIYIAGLDMTMIRLINILKWFLVSLIGRFLLGTPFVATFIIYTLRRRRRAMDPSVEDYLHDYRHLMPIRYSYNDVKRMAKNFKEKLGQGGYGSVFKGVLSNNHSIAIKIMAITKGNGQEFINEVASIGRIHHVNVVRLLGFVAERSKRALIYEFMPNGSLEKYIFPQEGNLVNPLSWIKMYEIALGIARGMDYLHRGCDMQILHFDIKPHNILLDENFIPKISDFGLAKLYSADDSIVSMTAARGTYGYFAPELLYRNIGGVSYKSDVYSFGVMLLEMAGRRRNINTFAKNPSQIYFPSWISDQLNRGKLIEMENVTDEKEAELAKKMIIVGLWCIQMKPIDRPSMLEVIEMLEGDLGLLQMPPKTDVWPDEDGNAVSMSLSNNVTSFS